jgi:antagonist of KipI
VSGTITVDDAGLFTTVQDLGRPGQARLGVSAAGAADATALVVANRLAGNPDGAAALEMTLKGGRFRFDAEAYVALAGADMQAAVDGRTLPAWSAASVPAGATLTCGMATTGARAVLAVRGGIRVPPVLGSASTHVPSGLGGHAGRALRPGDRLSIGDVAAGAPPVARRVDPGARAALAPDSFAGATTAPGFAVVTLRVTAGAQVDRFGAPARRVFVDSEYRIGGASDRMGLRLEGPPIPPPAGGTMLTEGMPLGAIQIPPAGQPVILFVDHQTTGGYPVIASIASADLSCVAQLRPGARVRFEMIAFDTARRLLLQRALAIEAASRFAS